MDDAAWYSRWRALANDDGPRPWSEPEDLFGFFQGFRPHGDGVERALEGLEDGEAILERLRAVYLATASGFDGQDAYFVVRRPEPLAPARASALAVAHARSMGTVARLAGSGRAATLAENPPSVEVVHGAAPMITSPPTSLGDAIFTELYAAQGDYLQGATPRGHPASLLREAFYSIACDGSLAAYLTWPATRDARTIDDPFAAYFELWKHGAVVRFRSLELLVVHVPTTGIGTQ